MKDREKEKGREREGEEGKNGRGEEEGSEDKNMFE